MRIPRRVLGRTPRLGLLLLLAGMLAAGPAAAADTAPARQPDTAPAGDSLTLERAFQLALEHNQNVRASREDVRAARQNTRLARSELLPELSASAQYFEQKEVTQFGAPFPAEEFNYSARLTQPLFRGGKSWYGWNVREREQHAARHEHFRRRQEILFQVARRYYGVLLARRNLNIARGDLARARQQLDLARGRLEVGEATETVVLRAQVQVARAEEQIEQARNERSVRREQLALELGLDRLPAPPAEQPERPSPEASRQEYLRRAMENRRDLARARERLRAARSSRHFQEADYYPRLNLVGRYDWFPQNERFHGTDEDWRVTLQATYPLFSGFREDAQLKRARARLRQARSRLERTVREVRVQVRSAYTDVQSQRKLVQTLRDQVAFARSNYQQVTAGFEQGVASPVDVVDAFTTLSEARSRLAAATVNQQLQVLRLRLATGEFQQDRLQRTNG